MQAFKGNPSDWNTLLRKFPNGHILQTWEWGTSKIRNGWVPESFIWLDEKEQTVACAMILCRHLRIGPLNLKVLYCPKGPTLDWQKPDLVHRVLNDLQAFAKAQKAIFLKIDPEILLGTGLPGKETEMPHLSGEKVLEDLKNRGWLFSQDQIQFRNTVFIDLTPDEDAILAVMKQKTRYNIRLATRRGVTVRQATFDDLPMLYKMYAHTAVRDDFAIRGADYYLELWESFMKAGMCHALIAEVEGEAVAGLFLLHFNQVSIYMYGMSTDKYRELMPNYLLQWEAMRLSKALGYTCYDMWGAPDVFDESDSMWGVYRFKDGFNGTTARHIGAWDCPSRPLLYKLYTGLLPRVLDLMRWRGKKATKADLG